MLLVRRNPRTVFRITMACLLVSSGLPLVAHPVTRLWMDVMDGVRGLFLGATLGLLALSGVLARRRGVDAAACGGSRAS